MALDLDLIKRLTLESDDAFARNDWPTWNRLYGELADHLHTNVGEVVSNAETVRDLADECPDLDPEDSRQLRELRQAIDEHLGWPDPESEERGDYVERVRALGVALENTVRRLHLLERGPDYGQSWFLAVLREATSIVREVVSYKVRPRV